MNLLFVYFNDVPSGERLDSLVYLHTDVYLARGLITYPNRQAEAFTAIISADSALEEVSVATVPRLNTDLQWVVKMAYEQTVKSIVWTDVCSGTSATALAKQQYTVLYCEPADEIGEWTPPIQVSVDAITLAGAEELILADSPQAKIIQVLCEDNLMYLPPQIPTDDRFNPALYRPQQLEMALRICGNLMDDYLQGEQQGGSMEWDELDTTHSLLRAELPELAAANDIAFHEQNQEPTIA